MSPQAPTLQVKDILAKTTGFFRDKGFESPRLDSELLIAEALKWKRMNLYLNHEYPLSEEELTACRELVKRRAAGEPVAYILGRKDFYNHSFIVNPSVLIPRPETEEMVERAVLWAKCEMADAGKIRVVDLGTGSGCIGLSFLAELPSSELLAVDLSADALAVAEQNAARMELKSRVTFVNQDAATLLASAVEKTMGGLADIVLANPPYIAKDDPQVDANVRKFEPNQALFSADEGLADLRSWSQTAARIARPGALVIFEMGCDQGSEAKSIFDNVGTFRDVEIVRDLSGKERFISCIVNSSEESSWTE
jgi:release factor glutamine methyltransferase